MAFNIIEFDPDNLQIDYQYIAKNTETGEDVVGFVVVDNPWYVTKKEYGYYILAPHFHNDGMRSMNYQRYKVDKDSIRPYTQTEDIAVKLAEGYQLELVNFITGDNGTSYTEETIATLSPGDKIPYELWMRSKEEPEPVKSEPEKESKPEIESKMEEEPAPTPAPEPKKRGRKKKNP